MVGSKSEVFRLPASSSQARHGHQELQAVGQHLHHPKERCQGSVVSTTFGLIFTFELKAKVGETGDASKEPDDKVLDNHEMSILTELLLLSS